MTNIVTTRFNDATWRENCVFREKNKLECVYSVPKSLSETIEYRSVLYVIEMNNSKNRIEGIGLIRNFIQPNRYKVYEENNWNRFCYIGKYYLSRDSIVEKNAHLLDILETVLFKGKSHMKRGQGMTTITEKIRRKMEIDVENEIKHLFLHKYKMMSVYNIDTPNPNPNE